VIKKYIGKGRPSGPPAWVVKLQLPGIRKKARAKDGDDDAGEEEAADEQDENGEEEDEFEDDESENEEGDEEENGEEVHGAMTDNDDEAEKPNEGKGDGKTEEAAPPRRRLSTKVDQTMAVAQTDAEEYDYGYDLEKRTAWRKKVNAKRSDHPEFALAMVEPEATDGEVDAMAEMLARFSTGPLVKVAQCTVGIYRASTPPSGNASKPGRRGGRGIGRGGRGRGRGLGDAAGAKGDTISCFQGHTELGEAVKVNFRNNDRKNKGTGEYIKQRHVFIEWENHKQLFQLDIKYFRGEGEDTNTDKTDRAAAAWANPIAEKFCGGKMSLEEVAQAKLDIIASVEASGGTTGGSDSKDAKVTATATTTSADLRGHDAEQPVAKKPACKTPTAPEQPAAATAAPTTSAVATPTAATVAPTQSAQPTPAPTTPVSSKRPLGSTSMMTPPRLDSDDDM
jgi:hypothetical protein